MTRRERLIASATRLWRTYKTRSYEYAEIARQLGCSASELNGRCSDRANAQDRARAARRYERQMAQEAAAIDVIAFCLALSRLKPLPWRRLYRCRLVARHGDVEELMLTGYSIEEVITSLDVNYGRCGPWPKMVEAPTVRIEEVAP